MNALYNLLLAFMIVLSAMPGSGAGYDIAVENAEVLPNGIMPIGGGDFRIDISDCTDIELDEDGNITFITENADSVRVQYYTYYQLGFEDAADYADYMGISENDWETAFLAIDYYYGYGTYTYENSEGCVFEPVEPRLALPGALMHATLGYTHDRILTYTYNALFVHESGVLFVECYTYEDDPEYGFTLRESALERITLGGKPIISGDLNPEAPEKLFHGKPDSVDIGGGFTFDCSGCLFAEDYYYPETGITEYIFHYSEGWVTAAFAPFESIGASRSQLEENLPRSGQEKIIAEYCYNAFSAHNADAGLIADAKKLNTGRFGEHAYVLFTYMYLSDGHASPETGCIITCEEGFITFSFCSISDYMPSNEVMDFFNKHLGSLYFEGENVVFE